jgi:hypothetical protein
MGPVMAPAPRCRLAAQQPIAGARPFDVSNASISSRWLAVGQQEFRPLPAHGHRQLYDVPNRRTPGVSVAASRDQQTAGTLRSAEARSACLKLPRLTRQPRRRDHCESHRCGETLLASRVDGNPYPFWW